ncbi:type IVB secretion system protein IcmH/DotU [Burkholderia stagnalis]|uniref:type IVB secretion system protein IcmH/DotU n=1 Tax=Burkholderia stagnalis TaxID=1503054 RepID=UPI0007C8007D|nr:type IVB secretion system protein IcmH/DotU [Burkholderia stagnalis]
MTTTFRSVDSSDAQREPTALPFGMRLRAVEAAANPLFEAARSLLSALADTPARLDDTQIAARRQWLEHEMKLFGRMCATLRVRADHVDHARYCLCAALDEAAMQKDWGRRGIDGVEWSTNGLAVVFGQDRQGGDRVFAVIDLALRSPLEHLDLLEVLQNILDLGFKGRFRYVAGGAGALADVRRRVHVAVVSSGVSPADGLVAMPSMHPMPRWQTDPWVRPVEVPRRKRRLAISAVCAAAVFGAASYAAFDRWGERWHRQPDADGVDVLARGLKARLSSEIAAGVVSVERDRNGDGITLRFGDLFSPGQVSISPWIGPAIAVVGQEAAKFPGLRVHVTGHTDNVPLAGASHVSNLTLSRQRADQVAKILVAAGVPADRIDSAGKADEVPIVGNNTEEGRARNRRVEISISE